MKMFEVTFPNEKKAIISNEKLVAIYKKKEGHKVVEIKEAPSKKEDGKKEGDK